MIFFYSLKEWNLWVHLIEVNSLKVRILWSEFSHYNIFIITTLKFLLNQYVVNAFFLVILSCSSVCLIFLKSGHFRYYITVTLNTSCLHLGFVIAIHLFAYLSLVWIISMRSTLPYSLSVKPLIFLSGSTALDIPKVTRRWLFFPRLPLSSPHQTQLLSATIC